MKQWLKNNAHDDKADCEIHQAGNNRGKRQNEAREKNFCNDALVLDHHGRAGLQRGREIGPRNQRRKIKHGVREPVGRQLGKAPKKSVKTPMVISGCSTARATPITVCLYRTFTSRQTKK